MIKTIEKKISYSIFFLNIYFFAFGQNWAYIGNKTHFPSREQTKPPHLQDCTRVINYKMTLLGIGGHL
jgi:hypothetical protein